MYTHLNGAFETPAVDKSKRASTFEYLIDSNSKERMASRKNNIPQQG